MTSFIKKLTDHFKVTKLKRHLKELNELQSSIHWSMQFDNLSNEEIKKNNRKLDCIELDKRITKGQIYSHKTKNTKEEL